MISRLTLLLTSLTIAATAQARPAKLSEVPVLVRALHRETTVKLDGSATDRWTWRLQIQRRDARDESGTRTIRFYKNFETVKILRAGTRNDGVFKKIRIEDLQERAVSDEDPGLSSLHEYVLSFPDVQEGSELEFVYEVTTQRALESGFWGQSFALESGAYEAFSWTIRSERSLSHFAQDPNGVIEASTDGGALIFRAKRPFSMAVADEVEPHLSNARKIYLLAGFLSEWQGYGVHSAGQFEARAREDLPAEDAAFARRIQTNKSVTEKIDRIMRHVTQRYRYFGDWRASEQMYVPRRFADIGRTQYGDCKDLALITVKMLREAGLEARPVWILNTEMPPAPELYRLPTDNAFNHVIVQVIDGPRTWWVDPTDPAGRSDFLADEIAGRPGLVLDEKGSRLIPIRPVEPADYRTVMEAEISPGGKQAAKARIQTRYEGFAGVPAGERLEADGLSYFAQDHARRLMPDAAVENVKVNQVTADRESGNLSAIEVSADFAGFWARTGVGPGFIPVRDEVIERLQQISLKDRDADLLLGRVYAANDTLRLRRLRPKVTKGWDCEVRSPWLDFSQELTSTKDGSDFRTKFALKKAELVLTPASRPAALKLQNDLRRCADRAVIMMKSLPGAHPN